MLHFTFAAVDRRFSVIAPNESEGSSFDQEKFHSPHHMQDHCSTCFGDGGNGTRGPLWRKGRRQGASGGGDQNMAPGGARGCQGLCGSVSCFGGIDVFWRLIEMFWFLLCWWVNCVSQRCAVMQFWSSCVLYKPGTRYMTVIG